jgi:poly(3-hydroxybutyrate) depolymerase
MCTRAWQQYCPALDMPDAVLAIQSSSAKRQYMQYTPSEEEKRRALMIVAEGYAGKTITEGCTSITRIVLLSDPSGGIVEEAYRSEPVDENWHNNFGATIHCQALRAKFTLDAVRRVRAGARNGEFFVAVFSGGVNTKMYKIKSKHQSKLGL